MSRVLALLALVLATGPAAAQVFHQLDPSGHHTNSLQPVTRLTSAAGVTFACFVDADLRVVVAGSVDLTQWVRQVVGTVLADAHNGCSIGVDPWGYLWVAWDLHDAPSFAGRLARSALPFDVATPFLPRDIGVSPAPFSVSYPVFYRSGGELYMLFRNGSSGAGDTWMLRMSGPDQWSVVAAPLLAGRPGWINPPDSAYLGSAWPAGNGDMHLAWTYRRGWYNSGVGYARFDRASFTFRRSDGSTYVLPILRGGAENALADNLADQTLLNSGLAITGTTDGRLHVGINRMAPSGYREVFYLTKQGGTIEPWLATQISSAAEPRVRISPCAPPDPAPTSPCDLEVQGPQIVASGNHIAVLWSVASARESPDTWSRPPSKLFISRPGPGGSWTTTRFVMPLDQLSGEMSRDTSGAPRVLYQELDGRSEGRPVSVLDLAGIFLP